MDRKSLKNRLAGYTCFTCIFVVENKYCINSEVIRKHGSVMRNNTEALADLPSERTCSFYTWNPIMLLDKGTDSPYNVNLKKILKNQAEHLRNMKHE
jgi:hypothetical protein